MRAMTVTQIKYLENKLEGKINTLLDDKFYVVEYKSNSEREESTAGYSLQDFITWVKETATRKEIIDGMDSSGSLGNLYSANWNDALFDRVARNIANGTSLGMRFLKHTGVLTQYNKYVAQQDKRSALSEKLHLEKTAVMDAAIFASTPEEVQTAIAKFMSKK